MTPLLAPGDAISTARLVMRLAAGADTTLLPWLPSALAPEWEAGDVVPHVQAGEGIMIFPSSGPGAPIGLAVVLRDAPVPGAATVPLLAIDPAERFRGLGGEAALGIEAHIRERWGAKRVLAPVPEQRGLAVYFWLRLGYRPLIAAEAPWSLTGLGGRRLRGIWMARAAP